MIFDYIFQEKIMFVIIEDFDPIKASDFFFLFHQERSHIFSFGNLDFYNLLINYYQLLRKTNYEVLMEYNGEKYNWFRKFQSRDDMNSIEIECFQEFLNLSEDRKESIIEYSKSYPDPVLYQTLMIITRGTSKPVIRISEYLSKVLIGRGYELLK